MQINLFSNLLTNLIEKICNSLVKNGIVDNDDQELYIYGLHQGFIILLNLLTTVAIGVIFNMVWQSILFMIGYIPLRIYAGGYHARTQFRCYLISVLMISSVLGVIKTINLTGVLCFAVVGISVFVIYIFAPVADENKPLDTIEIDVYRKRARIITFVLTVLVLICWMLELRQVSICLSFVLGVESVMLIIGSVNRIFLLRYNQDR